MHVLCVSHSSRPFVEARTRLNALNRRFGPGRLDELPPWDTLPSVAASVPFSGGLSLWGVRRTDGRETDLVHLGFYNPPYKVQCATFVGDRLVVLASDRLDILDRDLTVVQTIRDPWLVGGHTVWAIDDDTVWVTSAPANAAMKVSLSQGAVVERRRMPDRYGTGYELSPEDDLSRHFIPTDLQPTHLNCAVPAGGDDILVSLWIPGVVGVLSADGEFREIVRGLRGLHGGRFHPRGDMITVADSTAGLVWFFDTADGSPRGRLDLNSAWLHDAEAIGDGLLAATLSDSNQIVLVDEADGELLCRVDCAPFGASTMFVTSHHVDPEWEKALLGRGEKSWSFTPPPPPPSGGRDLLDRTLRDGHLRLVSDKMRRAIDIRSVEDIGDDLLLLGRPVSLPAGRYRIQAEIDCQRGAVQLGLSGIKSDIEPSRESWIWLGTFDATRGRVNDVFELAEPTPAQIVVVGNNPSPSAVIASVNRLSLWHLGEASSQQDDAWIQQPLSDNYLAPLVNGREWFNFGEDDGVMARLTLDSGRPVQYDWLYASREVELSPGRYRFAAAISCQQGVVACGLVDLRSNNWYTQIELGPLTFSGQKELHLERPTLLRVVLAASNRYEPIPVRATVESIRIQPLDAEHPAVIPHSDQDMAAFEDERRWYTLQESGHFQLPLLAQTPLAYEYLARTANFPLPAGRYALQFSAHCWQGRIAVGVLDILGDTWLAQTTDSAVFDLKRERRVALVAFANNDPPEMVAAVLQSVSLRRLTRRKRRKPPPES